MITVTHGGGVKENYANAGSPHCHLSKGEKAIWTIKEGKGGGRLNGWLKFARSRRCFRAKIFASRVHFVIFSVFGAVSAKLWWLILRL